jgi:O-antigen ligase
VIGFLGSMMFFFLLFARKEKERRNVLVMVVLLISVFSLLIWMGIRPLLEEFSSVQNLSRDYDIQYRFQNWRDSTRLIRDFPLFGVGLEAFSSIFPTYKTSGLQYYYLYLENDYLQLLCEMGILGFVVFLWFIASLFLRVGWRYSKNEAEVMSSVHYIFLCGCLTGVMAIMIHSFWDFNMHIPSNALLLSMIIGLALANIHIESEGYSKHHLSPTS